MVSGRSFRSLAALLVAGLAASPGEAASRKATDVARDYVQRRARELGLVGSDVKEVVVSSAVPSRHNGVTHVYVQQRYRGIDVHNGIVNVNVLPDGKVLGAGNRFVAHIAAAAGAQSVRKAAPEAVAAAAERLNLKPTKAFDVLGRRGGADEQATLSDGGIAAEPIESRLVWLPVDGGVRLAWSIQIEEASGDHWWNAFVDAETGETLAVHDLIVQDSAQRIAERIARPATGALTAAGDPAALFPDIDGSSYNVFPLPFESPTDGDRSLVTGAADPAASPFGWHDTDGLAGAEFTVTRGNNVHAYVDAELPNNEPDPGSDPDGGAGLTFDFPLDLGQNPPAYRPAAVTNLFYWNNVVHDIAHGYGFDEFAGNFQVNNYGNGGLGNDYVRAEAQDRSGTNNANFSTPVDGSRPRMQMFVWTHPTPNLVTVNGGPIAGDYAAGRAVFGPQLTDIPPVTAGVVLVNDGTGPSTSDGCEALVGFPAGSIALLDRGICTFVIKVKTAQNAGATGVIVANNAPGVPPTMAGVDPTITIPSVSVSQDHGTLFKANLPFNATLRSNPLTSINRDSDLDAGVISHEYGHGISNRLTGGPAIVSCLQNLEQMGEGWSDWFALTFTTHPSDTATTPRGIATYVVYQPADGVGIRPTQYTTDMSINPSTYASVADEANISRPHGIGYVWNTMLWEVYWNLVDRHGYNADVYGDWTTGGNNRALQLVMDGMKFQVCSPGFVDGRNGILQADVALTGGQNRCEIWRGFAKRGLGASANQGSSNNRSDGTQAFDLPASCTTAVFGAFQPPVANPPAINSRDAGADVPLKFTLSDAGSSWVIDSQPIDCATLVPTGEVPIVIATGPASQKGTRYHIDWATDPSWEGTCRKVTLRIPAATDAVAYFSFH